MVLEPTFGLLKKIFSEENLLMEREMGKEFLNGQMVANIVVSLKMENKMAMGFFIEKIIK